VQVMRDRPAQIARRCHCSEVLANAAIGKGPRASRLAGIASSRIGSQSRLRRSSGASHSGSGVPGPAGPRF